MMKLNLKQRWQKLTDTQQDFIVYIVICFFIMVISSIVYQSFDLPEIRPELFIHKSLLPLYFISSLLVLVGFSGAMLILGMFIESVRKHD